MLGGGEVAKCVDKIEHENESLSNATVAAPQDPPPVGISWQIEVLYDLAAHSTEPNEVEAVLQRALKIAEKELKIRVNELDDTNHPDVACALDTLAANQAEQGIFEEVEHTLERALEVREKLLGKDHLDVAKQLSDLARFCQKQGKYTEVEQYCKRAKDIYVKRLGADHPQVTLTQSKQASAYMLLELERSERAFGKDSPEVAATLNNQAVQ
jgi:hypothetical protein